ncbi:MAG TPA: GNAT family N-acetyltransferase [Acidimicrobiales bacterium]|nr:GNAT family N-acetyltransferase [Acidimicrobiales bacterium]
MTSASDPATDDAAHSRLLIRQDGVEAELVYRRNGRRLVLIHTGVPEEIGGRGIAGRLVRAAVDQARAEGLTLVPVCPYATKWLQEHPDELAGVAVDWQPSGAGAPDDEGP